MYQKPEPKQAKNCISAPRRDNLYKPCRDEQLTDLPRRDKPYIPRRDEPAWNRIPTLAVTIVPRQGLQGLPRRASWVRPNRPKISNFDLNFLNPKIPKQIDIIDQ